MVNFAHGSFYMLGAYIAYSVIELFGREAGAMGFWGGIVLAALLGAYLLVSRKLPARSGLSGTGWKLLLVCVAGLCGNYLLYLLGQSLFARINGFALSLGFSAGFIKVSGYLLLALYLFISVLVLIKLFFRDD